MGNWFYKYNLHNYNENDIIYLQEKIDIKNKQIKQYYELLEEKANNNMKLLKYYFLLQSNKFNNNDNLTLIEHKIKEQNYKIKKIKDIFDYEVNILNELINYKNKIL